MKKNAVVVGAGIVGASVALELARKGYKVGVLEELTGPGQGSTARSSSVIRCHYTKRDAVALAHEGQRLWANWSAYTGLASPRATYHQTGVLFLFRRGSGGPPSESLGVKAEMDQSDIDERVSIMRDIGVQVELLEGEELRTKFPFFAFPDDDLVGIWEPESGFVYSPEEAVLDVHEAGLRAGVEFQFEASFLGTETEWINDTRVIRACRFRKDSQDHLIPCDVLVNCAGPASHNVNLLANCPLPLATAPQRQFIVEATWNQASTMPIPGMADLAEGFYIRPHGEVFKVGAALPSDHVEFSAAARDASEPDARRDFEARVLAGLTRRAPGIELTEIETREALYDWTVADAYPILDATDVSGFYVAIGTSGAWFKSGPVIGQLTAELIVRHQGGIRDKSIQVPMTGNTIDMTIFGCRGRS